MSGTLIPVSDLSVSKYGDESAFGAVSTASGFLPRLQLFGSNSDPVKRGRIPMAHYGLVIQKDQIEDLGPEVDLIPFSWRPKAMRMGAKGTAPVSYFNHKSEDFLKIQQESEKQDSGCMYGPEFLCYIPSAKKYATFFMSSKTARRQAPEMRALLRSGATLSAQLIETQQYSWHGPVIKPCSTVFDNLPPIEEFKKQAEVFNNPEESSIEFEPEKLEAEPAEGVRPR